MTRSRSFLMGPLAAALVVSSIASERGLAAPISPGNLVVTRAVGGTADTAGGGGSIGAITTPSVLTGSGAAATVFLDEYTTSGVLVQSIQLPNVKNTTGGAGTYALTFSGTQNNEGAITLSQNGQYLTVAGYNQSAGPAALGGTNAAASGVIAADGTLSHVTATGTQSVQRVVGVIGLDGSVDTTTGLLDVSSGQSIRSAYTTNGSDIWVGGSNGANIATTVPGATVTAGVHYTTKGSTISTALTHGNTNQRILNGFNGQLYFSSNAATNQSSTTSGAFRGVATVGTGFPTSLVSPPALLPVTQLPGFEDAVASPTLTAEAADDYWFADENTLYIADQRNTGPSGTPPVVLPTNGGVQKWVFTDTNADLTPDKWVFHYLARLGLSEINAGADTRTVGAHGLTGIKNPYTGQVTLFATTFDNAGAASNRLVKLIDNGNATDFQNSLTVLATSPDNGGFDTAFRGVELIPIAIPEPTGLALIGLVMLMGMRWRRL